MVSRERGSRVESYSTLDDAMTAWKAFVDHGSRVQDFIRSLELESRRVSYSTMCLLGANFKA